MGTMEVTGDELAGVTDLFGALTPAELRRAIDELAFKHGEETPDVPSDIEAAIEEYRLVAIAIDDGQDESDSEDSRLEPEDRGERRPTGDDSARDDRLLVPGPTAFPTLPAGATDLPHILAIDEREMDRDRLEESAERRFRTDAARAVADGDRTEAERLLDVSYDLESWGALDLADVRDRLDAAADE